MPAKPYCTTVMERVADALGVRESVQLCLLPGVPAQPVARVEYGGTARVRAEILRQSVDSFWIEFTIGWRGGEFPFTLDLAPYRSIRMARAFALSALEATMVPGRRDSEGLPVRYTWTLEEVVAQLGRWRGPRCVVCGAPCPHDDRFLVADDARLFSALSRLDGCVHEACGQRAIESFNA